MANSQELGRKMATTSPGASPAEMRPRARDSTRLPYSAKVKRRSQEVSIRAVLLSFRRQLWRTTSWTKRSVGSAYNLVRSIGGDCNGRWGKLEVRLQRAAELLRSLDGETCVRENSFSGNRVERNTGESSPGRGEPA